MGFCANQGIDLVVVGPEAPLVAGVVDAFGKDPAAPPVVGPSQAAAQLEGSKAFAKAFMERHAIPTAAYRAFTAKETEAGLAYLAEADLPIVLKADGLAAGKGVVICASRESAQAEFRAMLGGKFGEAGDRVVVEQFLHGIEMSVFALTDGTDFVLLPTSKDYKRIGEGDTGLNTGGMGAVSPVPFADETLMRKIRERIIGPTVAGLRADGLDYRGFIYAGLMVVDGEPLIIEYNCRLGDPETQAVLPLVAEDLLPLLAALPAGELGPNRTIASHAGISVALILASGGYPEAYQKGKRIVGAEAPDALLFHAGTRLSPEGDLETNGGRVLAVNARGSNLEEALQAAYQAADHVSFDGIYRRNDIGFDLV